MDKMIGHAKGDWAWVHMDNLPIFSHTFNNRLCHLPDMFEQIWNQNLNVKITKCEFVPREMLYLGHNVCKS